MAQIRFSNAFILVIAIILMPTIVSAIGVSPSRVTVDFVPGESFESSACFETAGITQLKIEKIGWLENNIEIIGPGSDGFLDTEKDGNCIQYIVTLPLSFEKPGVQYSGISAVEVPVETGANIYAVAKIIHQVFVVVPYPGKYLEAGQLAIQNMPAGEKVPMVISVTNKGSEIITSTSGTIKVYDHNNALIATLHTNTINSITPNSQHLFSATWDSGNYKAGNYKADLQLVYDNANINTSSGFKLGGLDLSVSNYTQEVIIGGIKQFSILVDSIWSENIQAKATVTIYNGTKDRTLQQFETITKTVPAWSGEILQGYINTDSLGLGEFDVEITLEFEGTTKSTTGKVRIIEPPKAEEPKVSFLSQAFTTRNLIIVMALVLVIILVLAAKELIPKKKGPEGQASAPK
jgi:hypothetical protein